MSTAAFYLVALLTAAVLWPRTRTRPPFEWVGELATLLASFLVAAVAAGALWAVGL